MGYNAGLLNTDSIRVLRTSVQSSLGKNLYRILISLQIAQIPQRACVAAASSTATYVRIILAVRYVARTRNRLARALPSSAAVITASAIFRQTRQMLTLRPGKLAVCKTILDSIMTAKSLCNPNRCYSRLVFKLSDMVLPSRALLKVSAPPHGNSRHGTTTCTRKPELRL